MKPLFSEDASIIKIYLAAVASMIFSFTNAEMLLKIGVLSVTFFYTCWKFYTDYTNNRKKKLKKDFENKN